MFIENTSYDSNDAASEEAIVSPSDQAAEGEKGSLRDSRGVRTLVGITEMFVGAGAMLLAAQDLGQDHPELPVPAKIALGVVGFALFARGQNTAPIGFNAPSNKH